VSVFAGCGYAQVINYSFMAEDWTVTTPADDLLRSVVPLRNPLSKEAGVLRTTLIPACADGGAKPESGPP
jgi:phenylalanyl-tRNA synthetase beta subunit